MWNPNENVILILSSINPDCLKYSSLGVLIFEEFVYTKTLLKKQASFASEDPYGNTGLNLAARRGNLDVIIVFLEFGMNVNQRGYRGWFWSY
jgi:ankyrin repeat protein